MGGKPKVGKIRLSIGWYLDSDQRKRFLKSLNQKKKRVFRNTITFVSTCPSLFWQFCTYFKSHFGQGLVLKVDKVKRDFLIENNFYKYYFLELIWIEKNFEVLNQIFIF